MFLKFISRLCREVDGRLLWRFALGAAVRGAISMYRFERRSRRGVCFPPVLFISLTNRCNLRCTGCWVTVASDDAASLDPATLDSVIVQAKRRGNHFFGLLGGEPLLYDGLWPLLNRHRDCYFQLLTNGTLLTGEIAERMRQAGNVTPLISIEGKHEVSDERRGGVNVYRRALQAIEHCRRNRLFVGVATSVCQSNIDELVNEQFVRELVDRGVHYVWYYVYRPVGPNPDPQLALSEQQIARLRRFIVEARVWAPLMIVDAYWDHLGRAVCPAATGISHHVNAWGDIEPCPPIQFAAENLHDNGDAFATLTGSQFLADFRQLASQTGRGCILMERPDVLRDFMVKQSARDTSGRGSALAELAAMSPRASHDLPAGEIPERHWMYRLAKKKWFFGFGAYG